MGVTRSRAEDRTFAPFTKSRSIKSRSIERRSIKRIGHSRRRTCINDARASRPNAKCHQGRMPNAIKAERASRPIVGHPASFHQGRTRDIRGHFIKANRGTSGVISSRPNAGYPGPFHQGQTRITDACAPRPRAVHPSTQKAVHRPSTPEAVRRRRPRTFAFGSSRGQAGAGQRIGHSHRTFAREAGQRIGHSRRSHSRRRSQLGQRCSIKDEGHGSSIEDEGVPSRTKVFHQGRRRSIKDEGVPSRTKAMGVNRRSPGAMAVKGESPGAMAVKGDSPGAMAMGKPYFSV